MEQKSLKRHCSPVEGLAAAGERRSSKACAPPMTVDTRSCGVVSKENMNNDIHASSGPTSSSSVVRCHLQWAPEKFLNIVLANFHSVEALKRELLQFTRLEFTQGLDIVYKDKDGDIMLLSEQSWNFFKKNVQEMWIRKSDQQQQ